MKEPEEYLDEHRDNHPDDVMETAREVIERWDGWKYGKSAAGGAAGAVYIGYMIHQDGGPTQPELADEFGVTPPTLRKRYKDLPKP